MYQELRQAWEELTAKGSPFELEEVVVEGEKILSYKNQVPSLRELWLASKHFDDRDYLVYEEERITYTEAHQQVANVANWLLSQGVTSGDRVAIAMRNYPEWMIGYWACVSIGVACVGMNAWWATPELAYAIEDATPKAIIVDEERLAQLPTLSEMSESIRIIAVRAQNSDPRVTHWDSVVDGKTELPEMTIHPDTDACIFYTSGTTGRPKGAQLTHRGCVANAMSLAFANIVQAKASSLVGESSSEPQRERKVQQPSALVITPLFHVTANNCVAHSMTMAGGKLVHMYKWDPGKALTLIESEKITTMSGVPVMSRELISHPNFSSTDTSSLKSVGGGGAQLQPDLVEKIETTVATARPSTGYGMTETSGIITAIAADFFLDKPESAGPAMPCFEAQCFDDEGIPVESGELGELWVRGAQVIRGYLNRPEATSETITNGWLHTGDIARIDDEGFIYIVDRKKDMVLRGGENIYCAEVESVIFEHSSVGEVSVFGVLDDRLGEEVGAAVHLINDVTLTADELRSFLSSRMAKHKIPRFIWFTESPLPRNASGKFLKRELREKLQLEDSL
ncbi:MAG: class I adenylate-forming enzyme family protein [Acidimicrobiales bacterium]|nr:class I adenylate-forming enzyme family protein [Acidimicrobiales bacterium]MDP6298253.1 class I adenylate-forming enzyme family protein [Acidimicrobiales bacterium]HJM29023.1 class I adenylate-forming enzyme family protein [Acidimicrobiales bacterium]HJM97536.1 class I adenylate-forming enzyme family protein [Acidimicrobiales bacterium]